MPHALPDAELRAWLALLDASALGPAMARALRARHGSARAALEAGRGAWVADGLDHESIAALARPDPARVDAALRWLEAPDHHLLLAGGDELPPALERIAQPPAALFVVGDPSVLWTAQLAIVGSRNATSGGLAHARDFAATLAQAGLTITSGLALGIDGAAHAAALDAGGATIAVCGTGLDRVYPRRHAALARRIAERGALVSEFPLGTGPRADHFPRRNRLIAGLALGTLVVEAGIASGSLITARLAVEAGRDVFAIPGSIHNPLARGCHRLIREGAKLVETARDVLDELGPSARALGSELAQRLAQPAAPAPATRTPSAPRGARSSATPASPADPDYRCLRAALAHDPLTIDELVARTGLTVPVVSSMLLLMELDGEVTAQSGARYAKAP
jgi:DNA processing protein